MARKTTHRQPDRIHWDREAAFRDEPYRQLQHQKGLMGVFKVRLLEAAELERCYWSALALGPVKHLGLSTAHGPVSSYCTFTMDSEPHNMSSELHHASVDDGKMNSKMPANKRMTEKPLSHPTVVSPVVPQDNHPVWSDFHFEMPLRKGTLREDGMRIFVTVRVDEDAHVAEKLIPGLPKGDDRLIGRGRVDVTSLCLGEKLLGQTQVDVLDAWIPIYYSTEDEEKQVKQQQFAVASAASAKAYHDTDPLKPPASAPRQRKQVGKVRVLIQYRPNGMNPQQNDTVALESFARRPLRRATCGPILPPLLPMTVREVKDRYLLVEYQLPMAAPTTTSNGNEYRRDNRACMRIHRNNVFVIERKNLVDATVGLALLPADAIMSTPLGQTGAQILGPAFNAGKEILMPALLSFKLVLFALRTTTMAGLTGVQAAGGAIWHEGASAWTNQNEESQYNAERQRARANMSQL